MGNKDGKILHDIENVGVKERQSLFKKYDKNHDGDLSEIELKHLVNDLLLHIKPDNDHNLIEFAGNNFKLRTATDFKEDTKLSAWKEFSKEHDSLAEDIKIKTANAFHAILLKSGKKTISSEDFGNFDWEHLWGEVKKEIKILDEKELREIVFPTLLLKEWNIRSSSKTSAYYFNDNAPTLDSMVQVQEWIPGGAIQFKDNSDGSACIAKISIAPGYRGDSKINKTKKAAYSSCCDFDFKTGTGEFLNNGQMSFTLQSKSEEQSFNGFADFSKLNSGIWRLKGHFQEIHNNLNSDLRFTDGDFEWLFFLTGSELVEF